MIAPILIVGVLILAALLLGGAAAGLALQDSRRKYRRLHPSVQDRRKELDIKIRLGQITDDEYAYQTLALDQETEEANLRRRER